MQTTPVYLDWFLNDLWKKLTMCDRKSKCFGRVNHALTEPLLDLADVKYELCTLY